MKKKILIGSILAVALLTLVSFSSVVGKVTSDNNLVEIDVEFSGIGRKHTVQLTQQEADEVDLLFDDIKQRLSEVETREEAEIIFKEAIVELDKYGLLGGLSVRQVQRLVTFKHPFSRNNYLDVMPDDENHFCSISGETTNTRFFPMSIALLFQLPLGEIWFYINLIYAVITDQFLYSIIPLIPLKIYSSIAFGSHWEMMGEWRFVYSEGEIWTKGTNGVKVWNGTFGGGLPWVVVGMNDYLLGVKGFYGIQISEGDITNFFGTARKVKIENV